MQGQIGAENNSEKGKLTGCVEVQLLQLGFKIHSLFLPLVRVFILIA